LVPAPVFHIRQIAAACKLLSRIAGYRTARELRDLVDLGTSVTQVARHIEIGRSTAYRMLQDAHL